ncbi:MAG: YidC/Oxa1 family insertase periplasmic-domain containing protein [Phycisphaerae bacterium]|nr:YidC/Oxa1 family insertase periplasmic-domain containing protein [Phycisphaerae bacterium]
MQSRRTIYALFASVAVFYLWMLIAQKYFIKPQPPSATQPAATQTATTQVSEPFATTRPAGTTPTSAEASIAATTEPATPSTGQVQVVGGEDQTPVVLGSTRPGGPFPMAVQILPRGAAISTVELRDHDKSIEHKAPYPLLSPLVASDPMGREQALPSFVTPKVRFENLGLDVDLDRITWKVESTTTNEVVLSARVQRPDRKPIARLVKTYSLANQLPNPDVPANRTYDLGLSLKIENLSESNLEAIIVQQGPLGMRKENSRAEDRSLLAVYWEQGKLVNKSCVRSDVISKKLTLLAKDSDAGGTRVAWTAQSNMYFTCIVAPRDRTSPEDRPRFASVEAAALTPDAVNRVEDLTFRYITTPISIAKGGSQEVNFDCYMGPKSKEAFEKNATYRQRDYYQVIAQAFYFCAPASLVSLMMNLLNVFHKIPPHNYGIAIIVLVLVVRAVLHPITKKSQVNMFKMQKQQATLQPKIAALREKYGNDKAKLQQATMQVYSEAGINPAGTILSCLPLMLQIPIWGALWTALACTVDMRHAPFDGWWIKDLAGADAIYTFSKPIEIPLLSYLMGGPMESINILPILLGISQILQTKYMPHSSTPQQKGAAHDQMEQQRKMMMFMSVFFIFLLYNAPSGLNLYIASSNFFGIIEQWRIRKHLAVLENRHAQEQALRKTDDQPRPKSWLQQKWDRLSKEIEDAKKIESTRKKK